MSSNIRFIYLIEPISHLIPHVQKPKIPIKPNEKLVWTGMVLFIYLIYSQIPLYGIYKTQDADPLHYMRIILASSKGTLAELGITPIITASLIFGLLRSIRVIAVDPNVKQDRFLFEQTTKFVAIIMTIGQAFAYVKGGMYGPVNLIGFFNSILLIVQLVIGGIIIIILDEILSKEYGLISGISLFVATNISENLMWKCFSPFTVASERGIEYEGSIIAFFHFLITKKNKLEALRLAFFRRSSPNILQLLSTLAITLLIIYLWRFKTNVKITSKNAPGATHNLPIKLFYSSTTPIIVINMVISHLYVISQILYRRYGSSFIIKLLGTWAEKNGEQVATGGIVYFVTPPKDFFEFITRPLKSITYIIFILYFSGWFTQTMVELTGKGPLDLAKALKNQGFFLEGIRENEKSIYERLEKLIPTVSFLSGMVIAALQILADLIGATGSGTGILLLVSTILQVQENTEEKSFKGNVNVLLEE